METKSNSKKKWPFNGLNQSAVWSVFDSMETLLEIKRIVEEKTTKEWLYFYLTIIVSATISFILFIYVDRIILIPVVIIFIYILFLRLSKVKRLKYQALDLNSRIVQVARKNNEFETKTNSDIIAYIHCKNCFQTKNEKIAVGLTKQEKVEVWCENCNSILYK